MTDRCLASLRSEQGVAFRIYLWDNGSTDGTTRHVRTQYPEVIVHHHTTNAGVASGRNLAARQAMEALKPRYLLFLDNDTTVDPNLMLRLVAPFNENPRLAQTTGKLRFQDGSGRIYGAGGCEIRFWTGSTKHVGYGERESAKHNVAKRCLPSGGCMMVRADAFEAIGGFDATFDPYGPEDLDLGLRLQKAGYFGLYVPEAVLYHSPTPGRTFERGSYSELYAKHRAHHWFKFMARHAPFHQKLGFYLLGAPYRASILTIRELRRGNLRPAVRGLLLGFRAFWRS